MKVVSEISVSEFKAWSGGKDTLKQIASVERLAELDEIAEEVFPNGCTDTELNDWLWFDREFIYSNLGLTEDGELPNEDEE